MAYRVTTATLSPVSARQMLVVFKLPFHGTVLLVRFTVKHIWLFQQAEVLSGFNAAERDEPIQFEYDDHGEPDGHIAQGAGARSADRRTIRSRDRRPGRSGGRCSAKTRLDHRADSKWLRTLGLHKYTPNSEGASWSQLEAGKEMAVMMNGKARRVSESRHRSSQRSVRIGRRKFV